MKKLLTILIICFLLFSCKDEPIKCIKPSFYKKGDIVYLKPDSLRAIITDVNVENYNTSTKYTYDVEFYVLSERYLDQFVDTIYFYNTKKLKK
jgi:hypothetical protein